MISKINNSIDEFDFIKKTTVNTMYNTLIGHSKIHGFGLFAKRKLIKGSILCVLDGQVISKEQYNVIQNEIADNIKEYKKYFFMECNYISDKTILVRSFRTDYSYINHSRTPNAKILYNPLRVIAIVDIDVNQEITLDYRDEQLSIDYKNRPDKDFL